MIKDEVLHILISIADGIAETFGRSCETVIHEIEEKGYRIVYIKNGEVSGRKIGDTLSLIGYDYSLSDFYKGKDLINFEAKTTTGKSIKSTTLHIKGRDYHFSLGINYDFTLFLVMDGVIKNFIKTKSRYENIFAETGDVNITELIKQSVQEINVPLQMMNRDDKLRLIKRLDEKAAFNIKNSVNEVATFLGMSRYTVYNYLKKVRG